MVSLQVCPLCSLSWGLLPKTPVVLWWSFPQKQELIITLMSLSSRVFGPMCTADVAHLLIYNITPSIPDRHFYDNRSCTPCSTSVPWNTCSATLWDREKMKSILSL